MSYTHHAQEVLELPNNEMASIRYNSWNTEPSKTGKRTSYNLEVTLTTPNKYNDRLYDYLTKNNYKVLVRNPHTLEVTLKTNQEKKKETLTNKISDDVYLFFENDRLL